LSFKVIYSSLVIGFDPYGVRGQADVGDMRTVPEVARVVVAGREGAGLIEPLHLGD
jgi:hypothetical protein